MLLDGSDVSFRTAAWLGYEKLIGAPGTQLATGPFVIAQWKGALVGLALYTYRVESVCWLLIR